MAATALTVQNSPSRYTGNERDVTMSAGDAVNGNIITVNDDTLLIARNTGASTRTITIASQPDPVTGRRADITAQDIGAGKIFVYRFAKGGWADANDQITITVSHAEVTLGIIDLSTEDTT